MELAMISNNKDPIAKGRELNIVWDIYKLYANHSYGSVASPRPAEAGLQKLNQNQPPVFYKNKRQPPKTNGKS